MRGICTGRISNSKNQLNKTHMSVNDKPFLGRGWSFPPSFPSNGKSVGMVSAEEDIKQSLEILLRTELGERTMQPSYGSELSSLLFEPFDVTFGTYIKDRINSAILQYESRIISENIEIIPQPLEGRVDIEITFTISTTNTRHNIVFPFYIIEGTNIR